MGQGSCFRFLSLFVTISVTICHPKNCFWIQAEANLAIDGNFFAYAMSKKNLSIIVVILLTLLLIAFVIWFFEKRIGEIDERSQQLKVGIVKVPWAIGVIAGS